MVVLIVVIVLAVVLAGVVLAALVVPRRRGRTVELPPDVDAATRSAVVEAPPLDRDAVIDAEPRPTAAPPTEPAAPPAPTVETPEPTAGRLLRLRARLARSQSTLGPRAAVRALAGASSTTTRGRRSRRRC